VSVLENPEEYVSAQAKIISELASIEHKDFETKKEYIMRLREVTIPLIKSGYYEGVKLQDTASFIQKELLGKHGISYNNSGDYYSLFKENEKHSEKNPMSSRSREKISSPLPIEKQTGDDDIDRLRQAARSGEKLPQDYQYHTYLERIIDVSNETIKQSESLIRKLGGAFYFIDKFDKQFPDKKQLETDLRTGNSKKLKDLAELYDHYQQCEHVIESIESGIGTTPDKIEKLEETLAEQRYISKKIDERSKITFLEKWNTIIAEIEIGISAIAKKLGVNKKHLTNNVRPKENPVTHNENKHHKYISWFRAIQVTAPNGERFTFDAKDYFDKQIERGRLQIPFEPMVLKNAEL
jgi:DNA-binding phage protein